MCYLIALSFFQPFSLAILPLMLRLRPDLSVKLDLPHFVLNSLMAICQCGKQSKILFFLCRYRSASRCLFLLHLVTVQRGCSNKQVWKIRQGGATMHIGRLDEHLFWGETFSHTRFLWMKNGRRESHRYMRVYLCVWTSEGECNALLTRGIYLIIWPIVLFSFLGPFHTLSPSHLHCHRPGQLIHVPSAIVRPLEPRAL